jgi:hypothetical protein
MTGSAKQSSSEFWIASLLRPRLDGAGAFLFFWEKTDGQDVLFQDGKVKSGWRGDLHIIGELYI